MILVQNLKKNDNEFLNELFFSFLNSYKELLPNGVRVSHEQFFGDPRVKQNANYQFMAAFFSYSEYGFITRVDNEYYFS